MSGDKKRTAFISYAREDVDFVENELAPLCERHGYDAWWDRKGIAGGEDFERRIVEQLKKSDLFLLVMSQNARDSQWVRAELHVAFHLSIKVIPLLYQACDPLDYHISLPRLQLVDVRESAEALAEHLQRNVQADHLSAVGEPRDLVTELATVAITLLPWPELNHLRNLARRTAADYRGGRPVRHEVRHLCELGLLRRKPNRRIAELESGKIVDLGEFVELSGVGAELVKYIR